MKNLISNITINSVNTLDDVKKAFKYRETMINAEWLIHIYPSAILVWRSDYKPL